MPDSKCKHKWLTLAEDDYEETVIRSDLLCEHLDPALLNELVEEAAWCWLCGTLRLHLSVDRGEHEADEKMIKYLSPEPDDEGGRDE